MAGQVTGNIGNENVTLRNMATEDTLSDILAALQNKTISDTGDGGLRDKTKKLGGVVDGAAAAVRAGAGAFTNFFSNFGTGTVKIIRELDSNINNASYSFSAMARDQGAFSKALGFAANSINQLQEQYNSYSKMMQVGGAVTSDFEDLRINAASLGTDLVGLQRITEEYGFSLKMGSSTVALGLKKMTGAFKAITDDGQLVAEWGRLGYLPQQITEQMLLAAEAQGGVGDVLKAYGGDVAQFGKGMLKTTQDLTVFGTAIGSNSKIMQAEAAKAQQKITNKLFMDTLTAKEKEAVTYLQAFTGSAEEAVQVMRGYKTGFTSQQAGLFNSLKGMTGMGNQMDSFMKAITEGSAPLDALKNSGLLDFANSLSTEQLGKMSTAVEAYSTTNVEGYRLMSQQLNILKGLKDVKPEDLANVVNDLTGALDPKNAKGVDTFASLQNEQVKLANSTVVLNKQFNRLGLAIATGALAGSNAGIRAMGAGKDFLKRYLQDTLNTAGLNIEIPDDILNASNNKIEEWLQSVMQTAEKNSKEATAKDKVAGSANAVDPSSTLVAKNAKGQATTYSVQQLIADAKLRESTEAFKGPNNQVGTLVTAAMLQKKIPTLGMVNAGDDADPIHSASGKHPKGLALDFAVKDDGRDKKAVYEETVLAMKQVLMKDLGLSEKDFTVMNKLNAAGGSHIHFQFNDPAAADKVRTLYQNQMKPPEPEKAKADGTVDGAKKEAVSAASYGTNTSVVASTVNSIPTVNISKPDWFDQSMTEYASNANKLANTLGAKFDGLAQTIKTKLG